MKSAHRRTGKIKGIERILGTVDQLQESLIEVTSGQAKYEHHHRSIVWRCSRLPKDGQGIVMILKNSSFQKFKKKSSSSNRCIHNASNGGSHGTDEL